MVFDIITATALCPAIIATKQAIDGGSKGNQRAGNKSINQELYVRFPGGHPYRRKFEGARVVLMNGKLYVEHADSHFPPDSIHPACGRFQSSLEYSAAWAKVGHKGDCLTTTTPSSTHSSSPALVYVDLITHELKYGPPEEAEDHYPGPWSCTEIEHRVLFEGWEGWVVVQEDAGKDLWALYFDRSDDGLTGEGKVGDFETMGVQMRMLYVRLARREEPRTLGKHEQEKAEGKKKKEVLELDDDKSLL